MAETLKLGNGEWATKENSLLSYNDENGNYKPLPFDFTRASSATVVNKAGLIETVQSGIPRIDFLGNTNGALLLEPQRTNIITNSNSSNLNFTLDAVSMTYNSITSPDGENNGILLKQTGSNSSNAAYNFGLTTANGTYTYSIFIKANDSEKVRIYSSNGTTLVQDFNPQEMTEGVLSGNLNLDFKSYGNDWFRVSFTRTQSSAPNHRLSIYPDRFNTQKGIYIYGLQIESSASYPTSYIPTQGSSVTRVGESSIQTPPSGIIGQTEGTLFIDINISQIVNTEALVTINSGGYANNTTIAKIANIIQFVRNSATQSAASVLTSGAIAIGRHKIAIAYKSGDTAFYLDGTQVSTIQTETFTNETLTTFRLGGDAIGNIPADANYNESKLYNTRLSNSELATLTTL